ncbi:SAM-dependent methyltransferase [Ferrovibrio sp.]|uniref:class I SAM-dependent methyltransferase n=1 Tax=Ferrovibrio sp. TaxID=1917215 RepID=UPI0025C65245|nr:SAM-dependent methyltransferase [Ferrovibrio sp.]MBX3455095.1 SAM-dependent methyltransferase [Ferrovibrio sp.]
MTTGLFAHLAARITAEGPISLADYMTECLLHPRFGYYTTHDSIGMAGDFITAPEISQMFGELLGLWAADGWQALGRPAKLYLVEAGPGRGTLMHDALRAARALPPFRTAITPVLIEASPKLRAIQQATLGGEAALWLEDIAALPADAPFILLANEFLDALPIRQYQRGETGWHERRVALSEDGNGLRFVLDSQTLPLQTRPLQSRDAAPGAILETCPAAHAFIGEVAARIQSQSGMALFVDYGPAQSGFGDTFQALRNKGFADPLQHPGEADLTAHVDFASLARTANQAGIKAHGAVAQGDLLRRLGIEMRAEKLQQKATPEQSAAISAAMQRLTAADAMGNLFQAIALTAAESARPAGF